MTKSSENPNPKLPEPENVPAAVLESMMQANRLILIAGLRGTFQISLETAQAFLEQVELRQKEKSLEILKLWQEEESRRQKRESLPPH